MKTSAASLLVSVLLSFTFHVSATAQRAQSRSASATNAARPKLRRVFSEKAPEELLEHAILETLPDYTGQNMDGEESLARYYYNRVDLNGDGQPEVLVYLVGSYICGTGGCNLLVFRELQDSYQLISEISLVNQPVIVSITRTRGWNDLIVFVAGGGARARHAVLRFNGRTYPDNPSDAPNILKAKIAGTQFIADNINCEAETGIALRPAGRN